MNRQEQDLVRSVADLIQRCKVIPLDAIRTKGLVPQEGEIQLVESHPGRIGAKLWFYRRADGKVSLYTQPSRFFQAGTESSVVMDGWDERAALAIVLAAAAGHDLEDDLLRPFTGHVRDNLQASHLTKLRTKLQRVLDLVAQHPTSSLASYFQSMIPSYATDAVKLLHGRYLEFSGDDIRLAMSTVRDRFEFLVAKGVTEEEVVRLWRQTVAAEVMKA